VFTAAKFCSLAPEIPEQQSPYQTKLTPDSPVGMEGIDSPWVTLLAINNSSVRRKALHEVTRTSTSESTVAKLHIHINKMALKCKLLDLALNYTPASSGIWNNRGC
jgi:hypothetical protein